ncbi:MAG: efflux RND transporter periplasmic adaptor subunit, partial [Candidatus Sericytochromatia bacterium]|nr:efflux RND transporter periplasmic adaptor subunit [Candidatus Sericytochromatia bacterium]
MTKAKHVSIKLVNLVVIISILSTGLILALIYIINLRNDKLIISKESPEHKHTLIYNKKLSQENGKPVYTCPMHHQITSDHPGNCPICGMTLVKKKTTEVNITQKADSKSISNDSTEMNEISVSPSQQVLANIAVDTVKRKIISKDINTVGRITYNEKSLIHVSSWIAGRINILSINFTGAEISKGQKMMEIYSPDLVATQQEYITAYESYLRLKNSSFKDIADSSASLLGATRQKLLLLGIKDFQINELQVTKKPKINVAIYAPASGVIVKKNIQEGQYVNTGDILFDIANLSNVWMEADVYEYEIKNLNKGENIDISTDTYSGEIFKGVITFISPSLDPMTKTVKVRAEFKNVNYKLKPEMTVNARIHSISGKILVVPRTAVIITGKDPVVWVQKKEGVFIPKKVKLGQPTDEYYSILSGIKEGEKVAVSGSFLLDSESQINSMSDMPVTKETNISTSEKIINPNSDFSKGLKP